jgi:hypothetical protein
MVSVSLRRPSGALSLTFSVPYGAAAGNAAQANLPVSTLIRIWAPTGYTPNAPTEPSASASPASNATSSTTAPERHTGDRGHASDWVPSHMGSASDRTKHRCAERVPEHARHQVHTDREPAPQFQEWDANSPGPVCVGAVVDVHDPDHTLLLVDAEQDPVVAVASGAFVGKFSLERFAQRVRVLGQPLVDIDHDRGGDPSGQACHVALCGTGPFDPVTHRGGRPNRRRIS